MAFHAGNQMGNSLSYNLGLDYGPLAHYPADSPGNGGMPALGCITMSTTVARVDAIEHADICAINNTQGVKSMRTYDT